MKLQALKKEGFKQFVIKSVIFIALFIVLQYLTYPLAEQTVPDKIFRPHHIPNIGSAALFTFCMFVIYSWNKLIKLKKYKIDKKDWLIFGTLELIWLTVYYSFKFSVMNNAAFWIDYVTAVICLRYFLIFLVIANLAVAVYGRKFTQDFIKTFRKRLAFFFIVFLIYYAFVVYVQKSWVYLSKTVASITYFLLDKTTQNVTLDTSNINPVLGVEQFRAAIGAPCSGVESILLFISLYLLIITLDIKKIDKSKALLVFVLGVTGIFFLNIFRIYTLFLIGAYISKTFAIGTFHSNIGWILFTIYFALFIYFVYPLILKTRTSS